MAQTSCVGIGVDTLSIELGRVQECYVHRTLTGGNRVGAFRPATERGIIFYLTLF